MNATTKPLRRTDIRAAQLAAVADGRRSITSDGKAFARSAEEKMTGADTRAVRELRDAGLVQTRVEPTMRYGPRDLFLTGEGARVLAGWSGTVAVEYRRDLAAALLLVRDFTAFYRPLSSERWFEMLAGSSLIPADRVALERLAHLGLIQIAVAARDCNGHEVYPTAAGNALLESWGK